MKILVDADACPKSVLRICLNVGHKYGVPVWTVASFDHYIESDHHIIVGTDPQEADLKIINSTEAGDVVVTQDWGLAAIVVGKERGVWARVAANFVQKRWNSCWKRGRSRPNSGEAVAGQKGPKKRTSEDDRRFEGSLGKDRFTTEGIFR